MFSRRWFHRMGSAARWSVALALLYQSTGPLGRTHGPGGDDALTLPRAIPFEIRTEDDNRALAVTYRGALILRADGLHAVLDLGEAGPAPGIYGGLISIDAWSFGIAETSAAGFRLVKEEQIPSPQAGLRGAGKWYVNAPREYFLEGTVGEDLVDRWPVFIYDLRVAPGRLDRVAMPESASHIREYVHLPRDTFDRLLARRVWEG